MTETTARLGSCGICDGAGAECAHDLLSAARVNASKCSTAGGVLLHVHCHQALHRLLEREPQLSGMADRERASRIGIVRLRAQLRYAVADRMGAHR